VAADADAAGRRRAGGTARRRSAADRHQPRRKNRTRRVRQVLSARTCTRHTTCSHCIDLSTYRPLSAFKTLEVTHVYFRSRTTHRLCKRPQTPPPVLPAGVTLSTRHFLVPIIRRDVMCKHDLIYIQHARYGLVGPDCKK